MDQALRNKLRNVVTKCRKLLEDAVAQVLQGQFGIYPSGKKDDVHVEDASRMGHLGTDDSACRSDLLDHLEHIKAIGYKPKESLAQLVREVAFTHLNRLCAYKMMEAREVWVGGQRFREAVSRGLKSQGFLFYLAQHPEDEQRYNSGHQDVAYRHFLDWLGGTLSEEIGVLFSPTDPANRLYPPQRVLEDVLDLLNTGDIKAEEKELHEAWPKIWSQDETIGWVYQYFTPKELRDQARKESQAPRNSYELAFRNQFFTPRYVVQFLTDNTLGRIWYEMRQGQTKLTEQCSYMVRRPHEVFLAAGQEPPAETEQHDDLTQEELLKQPVHIPHRPKKDPRELRILDPACGSGHFLLYCFDLLLTIYEEAWADPDLGHALKQTYPTLDALRRDVPRLILAHNLHGIDIDLRATQIAALALWLRCQRVYKDMGLTKDRPKITRSNIVCAEPMPGEKEMLKEFVAEVQPPILGHLVEVVFDKMALAAEAGSLLKIEEELRSEIASVRTQWVAEHERVDRKGRPLLFSQAELDRARTTTPQRQLDFSQITDEQFWREAEGMVLEALRDYASHAANGGRLRRQLFAEDAGHGFAFVDVCQKQFDVVLMNPPFGNPCTTSKSYFSRAYRDAKDDLYACCVERGIQQLQTNGILGAITSRTAFYNSTFEEWRSWLLAHAEVQAFADLGHGVLDTALVETAAYCLAQKRDVGDYCPSLFIRLWHIAPSSKAEALRCSIASPDLNCHITSTTQFASIPGSPFVYYVPNEVLRLFSDLPTFETPRRSARGGAKTLDDFRFLRAAWEVQPDTVGQGKRWVRFSKGGTFSLYHADVHLLIDWENDGQRLRQFYAERASGEAWGGFARSEAFYFRPGITWPRRTNRACFRCLPSGCIFSEQGCAAFIEGDASEELLGLLGVMNSFAFRCLVRLQTGRTLLAQHFLVGIIRQTPIPESSGPLLAPLALQAVDLQRQDDLTEETTRLFLLPSLVLYRHSAGAVTASDLVSVAANRSKDRSERLAALQTQIDSLAWREYGVREGNSSAVEKLLGDGAKVDQSELGDVAEIEDEPINRNSAECQLAELLQWSVGNPFGRWDIRLAREGICQIDLPDPFALLPSCSPGMLRGDDGQPVRETPNGYPLRIDWDGILTDDYEHPDDIVRRVRDVLELIWKDRAEAIEKEASDILGVKGLRDYFRKPSNGGFWADHISRYSKSRRKAPIFWLLQSSKKNYALWLYYHRLDKDILFKALLNYVEPKIRMEESRLASMRSQKGAGSGTKKLDKDIEKQEDFLSELRDFEDKLRRAANLHLEPDLNDGVVLNIAPLWELVPWKEAKAYWEELMEGKYEWSSIGKQLRQKGLVRC